MKKLMSVLIALFVVALTFGVVACTPIDDSSSSSSSIDMPEVKLIVTLSESALTLDRYEEGVLTATVTDEEGNPVSEEVTWESDNLSVATINNGFVEATGVGSANITASVGEASATCVVTVEDTGALPVLNVSDESIELIVGGNYGVDASLTYKRNPVESATITYEILDTAVASVDENGNVTALQFGETTLRIVASWKGIDPAYLTQEIPVVVKEDVVVEIEQTEAVEIYTSNIELDGIQFANTATLTSKVLIAGSSEGVDASRISWASSNEDVLTVVNGVITAAGEGEAEVTVSYSTDAKTYTSTALKVSVLFPVVEKDVKVYLDASKATVGEQISASEIFGSELAIARILAFGESDDISASTTWLKEHDFGSEQERTYKLVVANAEYGYAISAVVVTKYITTAQELASLQSYCEVEEGSLGSTYYSYSGYFMLANNIIATGEEAPFKAPSMGSIGSAGHATDLAGFHGTFDGQGYTVKGFKFDVGGIFGDIGKGAVIKNVAFEDCDAAWRNFTAAEPVRQDGVGVLAANAAGNFLIENVFVELTGNCANGGALVGRSIKGGTIKNSVIIYNATGGWTMGAVSSWRMAESVAENVYVIMQGKTAQLFGNDASYSFASGSTFKVVKANEDASAIEYSNLPAEYWFAEPGMVPVFKTMVKELVLDQSEVSVDENGEVKLTASLKDIADGVITNNANWTSSNEEIATVENGKLTILGVGNVTITAQIGGYSATCAVEITEAELPVEDKTSVRLTLEAKNEASLAEQLIAEGVKAGLFANFEVASITDANGALVEENFIATADANNTREATLIVYAADKGYKVNVFVITKYIRAAAELASLQSYSEVTTGTNAGGATYYSYGGYFVLANNIIATGEEAPFKAPSMGSIGSGGHTTDLAGFHGTFDGQGYVVQGFKFDIGGIFGDIGEGAIIKNVAFEDCDAAWRNFTAAEGEYVRQDGVGVLAANAAGNFLIENVYVESTGNGANAAALVGRTMKGGIVRNTVVIYNATGGWNMGVISSWRVADTKAENVYVIMQGKTARIFGNGDGDTFASGSTFKVVKASEDATAIAYSGLSSNIWFAEPGMVPVFKTMVKELVLDQTEISVDTNGEVKLTASLKDIAGKVISNSANWTSSDEAIATVSNGLLNLLAAGKVTITAEIGGYRATCEVEIAEAEMVLVDKTEATLYLETANQASLAEQVVEAGVKAGLFASFEAVSVTDANGEALAENFIASADASNNREATLIVYSANKAYKVKVFVVTKAIRTAAELASLQSYSVVTEGSNGTKYYSYGGYFVLANNIIATGEEAPFKAPSMGSIGSGSHTTDLAGFHGTFDGQGYTVKGFKFDIGGIFGDIGKDAVIKNVAFEDCDAAWRNFTAAEPVRQDGVGVLAANAAGNFLIENVYVESTGNGANAAALVGRTIKNGTIKNSVIIYNATGGWSMGAVSSWRVSDIKAENVYVIMQGKTTQIFGNNANESFESGSTFKVVKANEDPTAIEYTNLPEEYWNVEAGKIATFKAKN